MATVYSSNHFRGDVYYERGVVTDTDIALASTAAAQALDKTHRAHPGLSARYRMKTAKMVIATIGGTDGDIVRCFPMSSGDRVHSVSVASMGTSTAYVCDVGLYLSGKNHDGAVVDANLFGAITPSTSITSEAGELGLDIFETGALNAEDRGDPLWHQANVALSGSVLENPNVSYDICLTATTTLTDVIEHVQIWCTYTSD